MLLCRWTILPLLVLCFLSITNAEDSATDVLVDIYRSCVSQFSVSCIRPKAIQWISERADNDIIKLTDDLSIIRTSNEENRNFGNLFEKVDSFLATHALKIEPTQMLQDETVRSYIPKSYLKGGLADGLVVPLSEEKSVEGMLTSIT